MWVTSLGSLGRISYGGNNRYLVIAPLFEIGGSHPDEKGFGTSISPFQPASVRALDDRCHSRPSSAYNVLEGDKVDHPISPLSIGIRHNSPSHRAGDFLIHLSKFKRFLCSVAALNSVQQQALRKIDQFL